MWQCNSHALIAKKGKVRWEMWMEIGNPETVSLSHSSLVPSSLHLALAASLECCPFATHTDSQRNLPFTRHQAFHHLILSGKSAHFLAIMEVSGSPVSLLFSAWRLKVNIELKISRDKGTVMNLAEWDSLFTPFTPVQYHTNSGVSEPSCMIVSYKNSHVWLFTSSLHSEVSVTEFF